MNPTHRTHRLSLTLAGLAAALALPACQSTAAAASHRPLHHAAQAMAPQAQTGLTVADLRDLANLKRDLFQRTAQQAQTGLTFTDLQDLAKMKRDLFQRLLGTRILLPPTGAPPDSGLAGCTSLSSTHQAAASSYPKIRAEFAGSRWPDLRTAGTAYADLITQLRTARGTDGYETVWFYQQLSAACARHGRPLTART